MERIDEAQLFRKISVRILPVLMLAFFFSYVNRVNVGFAKLQMTSDLHFSDAVYGFGAGIFFVGYFLLEVPSNMILHRIGARRWISRIMLTWGVLSCATIFIRTPMQFYVMRLLLGFAEAGFIPGAIYYMSQWYPAARRSRAWGVFYVALASSGMVGGLLSGTILRFMSGIGGLHGWQWLILCEGIPTIALGVYIFLRMDDEIGSVDWLSDAEKRHLKAVLASENRDKLETGFGSLLGDGRIWTLVAIYFAFTMGLYAISFWMPTLVQHMGVRNMLTIGLLSAIPCACAIVCMVAMGYSAGHYNDRRWHLTAAYVMAAIGFALCVLWQHQTWLGVFALCIANMGVLSIPALFWGLPTAMLTGATAAAGIAMINAIANLAGFVAPYLIGYLSAVTGRTDIALIVVGACLVVGALLVLLVTRDRPPSAQAVGRTA
ncbi:MFS transporter [Burkholderia sp. WAC0059]|uniref:MFS transporter n=1 Tax=Burkholderia sp. WAC0059 TaxID=2066022 RepID=UPI000C7F532A|nr:MFS transporter [Burkholderia sp. WAC0059]PLZ00765.1 MFS transporter [Burkholderia sp. WAC0059]